MGTSRTPRTGAGNSRPSAMLRAVHELFVAGEVDASYLESSSLRPIVAKSWQRSLAKGVDPDGAAQPSPVGEELARLRQAHPLAPALPVIRRLLVDDAAGSGVVVAVTGADGTLLWVEGDRSACRRAEAMNFIPGADWSERSAGTNAPGTALAVDAELQIHGSEHFSRVVQPWSCTAVPVHDPTTGALLGALDLTGGSRVASPQALALVRATVVAVESHLALLRLTGSVVEAAPRRPRLAVLGSERPRWLVTDEFGHLRATPLTGRHADILVLLSGHPEGLSADHLAMLLDDKDLDVVTVRAEMSRLRKVVGADVIDSRPYRLLVPITTDIGEVYEALEAGDVTAALDRYPGPLLPQSISPAVGRLRTELTMTLRAAVLATGDPAVLRRWLDSPDGRDDRDGWRALHDGTLPGSVHQAQARGKLAGLDFDLA
ncbi:GAF domain-containing protein [Mycobacterium sp. CVI_P3]|uniref:GAF domain-containing protein n=1 Tax=Mycobacterium pinniadriaticum TaxID=2994102 RepID=A0ABT3SDV4_9MYCO|nr:helix-turn-helix domain-containing protein [Mycobacterium pinniadriaticum]MCX2931077.1 GAF domain-containing protein [Mycobacterium pinniadriaticum]MCX2937699.1 GAF domain-containing protein [Mycobacterium pinniadriaticum]